jgi:hypothetical protein
MKKTPELENYETELIIDLLGDYRKGVVSGSISGFGQPNEDEVKDVDVLIAKLRCADW